MLSYPVAGAVFDFLPRLRRSLWIAVTIASGTLFILVAYAKSLWKIYPIVFLLGLVGGFGIIFYEASLSLAFTSEELVRVNSALRMTYSIIALAVPALAGLLVDEAGASIALILAGTILMLRIPLIGAITERISPGSSKEGMGSPKISLRRVLEGLSEIYKSEKGILLVILAMSSSEVFLAVVPTVHLILLVDSLGGSASEVGLLWSLMSLGGILASLALGAMKPRPKPLYMGAGILGLSILALTLSATRSTGLLAIVVLLWGLVQTTLLIVTDSFIQSSAPRNYKGTIISLRNTLDDIGFALSGIVSGLLIDTIGLRPSLITASAGSALIGASLVLIYKTNVSKILKSI